MLTAQQVMARLKLGRTTVYGLGRRFLETGGVEGLPCRKIGRSLRFPADELDAWVTALPTRATIRATSETVPDRPARPRTTSKSSSAARAGADANVGQAALPFAD